MIDTHYTYTRKDGSTVDCYGIPAEGSNYSVVCEDERDDGDVLSYEGPASWPSVCKYIERIAAGTVVQIEAI